ncbi:MAG: PH domain-containing protein [Cardiobacteriaceae bacterium]|nr:PH domain-containing protein [Cardiobacteriaceae bacterium]
MNNPHASQSALVPKTQKLHPSSPFFVLVNLIINNLFPFAMSIMIQFRGIQVNSWFFWLSLLILVGSVIGSFLYVQFYRYHTEAHQIVIQNGIFFKQQRSIPLKNLHNINIKQNPIHRLLKVAEIQLESAGSVTTSEACLRVVSLSEAEQLQTLWQQQSALTQPHVAPQNALAEEENLLPLSHKDLILLGLIRNDGFMWWLMILIFLPDEWVLAWLMKLAFGHWQVATLWLILLALVVGKASTILLSFITHSHFSLTQSRHHLTIKRGLFTKVEYHIPREKIQAWRIKKNPFHQWLGHSTLHIDSAMQGGTDQGRMMVREIIPLCRDKQLNPLLAKLTPPSSPIQLTHKPSLTYKPHPKMPQRLILRDTVLLLLLYSMIGLWGWFMKDAWAIKALWLLPVGAVSLCYLRFKQYQAMAWQWEQGVLHHRQGFLWRSYTLFPLAHRHAVVYQQSALDKHHRMAHLLLDSMGASSTIALTYLPEQHAQQIFSHLNPTRH